MTETKDMAGGEAGLDEVMETIRRTVRDGAESPMQMDMDNIIYSSHPHTMLDALVIETLEPILREWVRDYLPQMMETLLREWLATNMPHMIESLLREWLVANLPQMVEKIVRAEMLAMIARHYNGKA